MTLPAVSDRRADAGEQFFVTGGTVPLHARSYVERPADRELLALLTSGEYCYILTSRQMGKSSLVVRTADRLRVRGHAVVLLDLTAIGHNVSVEQWYRGLVERIGEQLYIEDEVEEMWETHSHLGPLQRWLYVLQRVILHLTAAPLTIFVDELDAVRVLPFKSDEFFAGIRQCFNRRAENPAYARLTFCLVGVATPSDLIQDPRWTPFNIGCRVELTDFTLAEARCLSEALRGSATAAGRQLRRILYWTGGHPYLTQQLCQVATRSPQISSPRHIDRLCHRLFLGPSALDKDSNLLFVADQLALDAAQNSNLLLLYTQVLARHTIRARRADPLTERLLLSGVVRSSEGRLSCRNRIYRRVFNKRWIDSQFSEPEREHQRAAFRKGMMRAAALSWVILSVMAGLTLQAVRESGKARAGNRLASERELLARHYLYVADMNLAEQAYAEGDVGRTDELLEECRPPPGRPDVRDTMWRYLWGVSHFRVLWRIRAHRGLVGSIAFSRDGRRIATSGYDGDVAMWEPSRGRPLTRFQSRGPAVPVAFCSDAGTLAIGERGKIDYYPGPERGQYSTRKEPVQPFQVAAISSGGTLLALLAKTGKVRLWDSITRREIILPKAASTDRSAVVLSKDGRHLFSASNHGDVRVWDTSSAYSKGRLLIRSKSRVRLLAVSGNARILAIASDFDVALVNVQTGARCDGFTGAGDPICSLSLSDNGQLLSIASVRGVAVWDTDHRKQRALYREPGEQLTAAALAPSGDRLAIGAQDGTLTLLAIPPLAQGSVSVRGTSSHLKKADTTARSQRRRAVTPDATLLAVSRSLGYVDVYGISALRSLTYLERLRLPITRRPGLTALHFSPNGKLLAVGLANHLAVVWDVRTGSVMGRFAPGGEADAVSCVAFSPDSGWFAVGTGYGGVAIWNLRHPSEEINLTAADGPVCSLCFSRENTTVVTAGENGSVKLWHLRTGQQVGTLQRSGPTPLRVEFSKDELSLFVENTDGSSRRWSLGAGVSVAP